MKIIIQSDLHLDYNKRKDEDIEEKYIQYMKERKEEKVIIAGDIAGSYRRTKRILRRLREEANKDVYFVIGNHDIYDDKNSVRVLEKLKEDESVLVNRSVAISLKDNNIKNTKIGFTMRQNGLGKLQWIEEAKEKGKKA